MEIKSLVMGYAQTNTYLIEDESEVILIDPCLDQGMDASKIEMMIGDNKVIGILLTHGHFDHISGVDYFAKKYNCPVYIHKNDYELLYDENKNLSSMTPEPFRLSTKVKILGDRVTLGNKTFEVIETFGHTPGSVSFKIDNICFDGDFIFKNSIGRCDLPYGNEILIKEYLHNFVKQYKDNDIILYSGHGPATTLYKEIEKNPYLAVQDNLGLSD